MPIIITLHIFGYTVTVRIKKGAESIGKTSSEAKIRWMKANYKRYQVQLRIDEDADLIAFIDKNKAKYGTTELFRTAIEKLKNEGLN